MFSMLKSRRYLIYVEIVLFFSICNCVAPGLQLPSVTEHRHTVTQGVRRVRVVYAVR